MERIFMLPCEWSDRGLWSGRGLVDTVATVPAEGFIRAGAAQAISCTSLAGPLFLWHPTTTTPTAPIIQPLQYTHTSSNKASREQPAQ